MINSNTEGRFFQELCVTESDLEKARGIPANGCPRRYCWWWISLSFEWDLTASEGCTLLKSPKPASFRYGDIPCCRSDSSSSVDHFEAREPHLEKDGIDPSRWIAFRAEKNPVNHDPTTGKFGTTAPE